MVEIAAPARPLPAGPDYVRRDPERETLHQLVREHLRTFYAAVEHGFDGASLPGFVRADLEGYVRCGVLGRGFDGICAPVQIGDYRIGLDMHAHLLWLRRREGDGWGQPVVALNELPEDANRVAMRSGKLVVFTQSVEDDEGKLLSATQVAKVDPASVFTDSDADGLTDLTEAFLGTDPHRADTDGDGEPDGQDAAPLLKADTSDAAKIRAAAVNYAVAFAFSVPCAWSTLPPGLVEIGGDAVPMGELATPDAIIQPASQGWIRLSSLVVTPPAASIALTALPNGPIRLTLRKQGETWRVVDSAFVK